jgi:hypothetical protein
LIQGATPSIVACSVASSARLHTSPHAILKTNSQSEICFFGMFAASIPTCFDPFMKAPRRMAATGMGSTEV